MKQLNGWKRISLLTSLLLFGACASPATAQPTAAATLPVSASGKPVAATQSEAPQPAVNGAPVVYFTSDISAARLVKVYDALNWQPTGPVAVKISTGEPPASNYLRPELIGQLVELENLVFGGWLKDESPVDVLRALTDFLGG